MTDRQLRLLVKYRLNEAEETLREAEILLEQSAFRGSVNRRLAQARVFVDEIKAQLAIAGFEL